MASGHQDLLAARVLNDHEIVTYRILSRSLGIHNNLAKRMLFDFHTIQNNKNPGSVHATYLVWGSKSVENTRLNSPANGNQNLNSTSLNKSMPHGQREHRQVMTLVSEENFQGLSSTYHTISSRHMYSVQHGKLQNLEVLSSVNSLVCDAEPTGNQVFSEKTAGVISCSFATRKKRKVAIDFSSVQRVDAEAEVPVEIDEGVKLRSPQSTSHQSLMSKANMSQNSKLRAPNSSISSSVKAKSGVFAAFTKSKRRSMEAPSRDTTPKLSNDSEMDVDENPQAEKEESEEEEEEEDMSQIIPAALSNKLQLQRKEREKQLQEMMDKEDEEMADSTSTLPEQLPPAIEDRQSESNPNLEDLETTNTQPSSILSSTKRRGRRRVVKKIKTRDAEGFLVTREEPGWESFSEEEPSPAPTKSKLQAASVKSRKAAASSGNIMSFFGKKNG